MPLAGLYFMIILSGNCQNINPSAREYEITDVNKMYSKWKFEVGYSSGGTAWLDTGTFLTA
jgi:dTDP-glucose pyrophosphorylase